LLPFAFPAVRQGKGASLYPAEPCGARANGKRHIKAKNMKQTRKQKQIEKVKVKFQRPTLQGYDNRVRYYSRNGNVRAEMPISHSIYRSILSTMKADGVKIYDILSGNKPLRIKGNLLGYSDEALQQMLENFVADIIFKES
jgi:hypothetical protein